MLAGVRRRNQIPRSERTLSGRISGPFRSRSQIRESKCLPIAPNRRTGASVFFPTNSVTYLDCPTSTTRRFDLMVSGIGASWQAGLGEAKGIVPRACRVGVSRNSVGSNRRWLPEKNRFNSTRWKKKRPSATDFGQKEQLGRNISFSRIVRPKVSMPRFLVQVLPSGISTSGNQTMTIRLPISWHSYRRMETRIWNYSKIQAMAGIFSLATNVSRRLTTTLRHQHEQIRVLLHA